MYSKITSSETTTMAAIENHLHYASITKCDTNLTQHTCSHSEKVRILLHIMGIKTESS